MKLEFWSDIVCPWCGLTEHRLAQALDQFEYGQDVQVIHRSFQTHPELDRQGVSQRQLLAQHGFDPGAAQAILGPIEQFAADEGLQPYKAIDRELGPTNYAHEMLAYATKLGVTDAWTKTYGAHFGTGRALWTIDQVAEFASELGLDPAAVREVLENGTYRAQVDSDQIAARKHGATGVPFIVIDRERVIAGARSTVDLLAALRSHWEQNPSPGDIPEAGPVCSPFHCA
jgi:predicted DsbA family dithiol-disulfide isomerase